MYPFVTSVEYYEKLVENEFLLNSSKMDNFIYIDGFPWSMLQELQISVVASDPAVW